MNYILPLLLFAGLGLLAGILLTLISKIFAVKTDEKLEAVQNALPQANCGACGFSGCNDYADAIVNKGEKTNKCNPGGKDTSDKINKILGLDAVDFEPVSAFVHCRGNCSSSPEKYEFDGVSSCEAANRFYGGSKLCEYGCLGLGDCVSVCSNNAIKILDGVAVIDEDLCTGCNMCAEICPKNLIALRRKDQKTDVSCNSKASGKDTRAVCTNGCLGCKMCIKVCPVGAIEVKDNLAQIDYGKCINCKACAEACRFGVITVK